MPNFSRKPKPRLLTDKQEVFLAELLASPKFNAAEAAEAAGYANPRAAAANLMKHPVVRRQLAAVRKKRFERLQVKGDRVVEELGYMALYDPIDLCDEEGRIDVSDLRKIPESIRRAISSLDIEDFFDAESGELTRRKIKLKLVDKVKAIELAMRHLGQLQPAQHNTNIQVNMNWDAMLGGGNNPSSANGGNSLGNPQIPDHLKGKAGSVKGTDGKLIDIPPGERQLSGPLDIDEADRDSQRQDRLRKQSPDYESPEDSLDGSDDLAGDSLDSPDDSDEGTPYEIDLDSDDSDTPVDEFFPVESSPASREVPGDSLGNNIEDDLGDSLGLELPPKSPNPKEDGSPESEVLGSQDGIPDDIADEDIGL